MNNDNNKNNNTTTSTTTTTYNKTLFRSFYWNIQTVKSDVTFK